MFASVVNFVKFIFTHSGPVTFKEDELSQGKNSTRRFVNDILNGTAHLRMEEDDSQTTDETSDVSSIVAGQGKNSKRNNSH